MRFATLGGLVSDCLGMLVVPPASGAPATKRPLPLLVPHGAHADPRQLPPHRARNASVTPGGCSGDTPPSFIGIAGLARLPSGNFAGSYSGVLGRFLNEACSTYDAIGGGNTNVIGGAADGGAAGDSFIGSGASNAITGPLAFIGAGQGNSIMDPDSFVGAGVANTENNDYTFAAPSSRSGLV